MENPIKFLKKPKDLEKYVINQAFIGYMIYNKKTEKAYCTRCGKYIKLDYINVMHNRKTECPKCGEQVVYKNINLGRQNITDYGRILWTKSKGKTTYVEIDKYAIDYTNGFKPTVELWPRAQYKFNKKVQIGYVHKSTCYPYPNQPDEWWEEMKSIYIPYEGGLGTWWSIYDYLEIYNKIELGTDMRYSDISQFRDEPIDFLKYMELFLKYQSIELLQKAGFEYLVEDKVKGARFGHIINWKATALTKILKINRKEIKRLREERGNQQLVLKLLRKLKKDLKDETIELETAAILNLSIPVAIWNDYEHIKSNIKKYAKYIAKKNVKMIDYKDYIEAAKELGYDLNKKEVQYPKDFYKAHDEMLAQKEEVQEKKNVKAFRKTIKKITRMSKPYVDKNYLIRPANQPDELTKEGQALNHCVGTYIDKVCRGDTSILFIRDINKPDEPLYTLELNKNREIVQVRADHNADPPKIAMDFVSKWYKQFQKEIKKKEVMA